MYRFINWFNNFKTRFRFKKFIPIILLGCFFIPSNVHAADYDISSVTSAVAYFEGCMGYSDNCTRVTSTAPSLTLPIYPLHYEGNNPYASIRHYQLDFAFRTPVTLNGVKAYNYEIAFNYAMSGLDKLYNREPVQVLVYPYNGRGYVKNFSGVTTTSVDVSNNKIVATGTIELAQTLDINYLVAEFAGKDSGSLGACSSFPGAMLGVCSNSTISQLSLLSISITPIIDTGDALLNDVVTNTQVTNEKLDELINDIGNDDVSSSKNDISSFFDNFNLEDNGGISGIVTLPLRVIEGLVSGGTCSDLNFSVLGKSVYFPSGCILWSDAPSSIVLIYQTLICGLFGYILCIRLFKDIESLKNPNDSGVSTLDL